MQSFFLGRSHLLSVVSDLRGLRYVAYMIACPSTTKFGARPKSYAAHSHSFFTNWRLLIGAFLASHHPASRHCRIVVNKHTLKQRVDDHKAVAFTDTIFTLSSLSSAPSV